MDAASEVKSRLNIEDVIGEYVSLKRAGRNFKGLSPFSSEKTPSFIVSPEKQIWKDFSSGKGGSVFDFIMEVEGLEFKEALEILARKAGVDLDQYRTNTSNNGINKERLYALLELSTKFYQTQFAGSKLALEYVLSTRKFSKDTALLWRLGYSPNSGNALVNFAHKRGFTDKEIKLCGLSSQSYRGQAQDMFRGRLMIPLQDNEGRIIGYTARLLIDDQKAPKYINTPQTVLYDKSRHIYGLHEAKQAIRKSNFSVIVEGNLDVIASHQADVKQTVATAGTALTESQLKILYRLSPDVRICFDNDRAGLAATERAIPLASKAKISLSVIDIKDGKDPDELIRRDPKIWQDSINSGKYALDWLIDKYKSELDLTTAKGKKEFSDVLLATVKLLSDPIEVDHYLNIIAKTINVDKDAVQSKIKGLYGPKDTKEKTLLKEVKPSSQKLDISQIEYQKTADRFMSLMLKRQTLRTLLNTFLSKEMLPTEDSQLLYATLLQKEGVKAEALEKVQNIADYVKIEVLLYDELYQGLELNELYDEATRLQADLVTKYVKMQKEELAEAQRSTSDESKLRNLQEKDRHYNLLLNQVKGAAHG